jgi:hypothetical protein
MTDMLRGDFVRDPGLGADTDWIVSAPTKRFYVDPTLAAARMRARRSRPASSSTTSARR